MVFIAILLLSIILAWKYGDWGNWEKYHPTMLLFGSGNLLYNFVYHDKFLWQLTPDILNHHIWEIIFSFSVLPLTALIFLSNLPADKRKLPFYLGKYVFIYVAIEFLLLKTGMMKYDFGWNIWWSLAWDIMMFCVLAIHNTKPLIAYSICMSVIFAMNFIFPFNLS